jgi:hypothetical protein
MGRCLLDCIAEGMVHVGTACESYFTAHDFSRCDGDGGRDPVSAPNWTKRYTLDKAGHRSTVSFFLPPSLVFFATPLHQML